MCLSVVGMLASELAVLDSLCSQERAAYSKWGHSELGSFASKTDAYVWSDELHPKQQQLCARPSRTIVRTSAASSLCTVDN